MKNKSAIYLCVCMYMHTELSAGCVIFCVLVFPPIFNKRGFHITLVCLIDRTRSDSFFFFPPEKSADGFVALGVKGAQGLLVGRAHFLFIITGFWLHRMSLALQMAATRRSRQHLFLWVMCQMLLRVAGCSC